MKRSTPIHPSQRLFSDDIVELHRKLREYDHQPLNMNAASTHWLVEQLASFHKQARALEKEVSRLKWNAQPDQLNQALINAVVNEASKPNTNIICVEFGRSVFTKGFPPEGGVA